MSTDRAKATSWSAVARLAEQLLTPALGRPASATQVALHPTRDLVAAACEVRDTVLGPARSVITLLGDGEPQLLRDGWRPAWSPTGTLAHLDDGGLQIGELRRPLTGHAERLAWSPDGTRLLLVVAEPGSELGNLSGSGLIGHPDEDAWVPTVHSTIAEAHWRRLVLVDASTGELSVVSRTDLNVWDACWAGEQVLAVCSDGSPAESAWWSADLRLLDPSTGADRVVATPDDQLGPIAASPSGRRIAWVGSVGSDRDLMAGDLWSLDLGTGERRRLADGTDVSDLGFVGEDEVGFVGLQGLTTVVGRAPLDEPVSTTWSSTELTTSGANPTASFHLQRSAFTRQGFRRAPEVVLTDGLGAETVLASLLADLPDQSAGSSDRVHRWSAPDGTQVEGWLRLPTGDGPHPLVVILHGGPVSSHRTGWSLLNLAAPLLLADGYALLLPNPRGSSGRGQAFTRAVVGDMGGADADDITSGIRSLIDDGTVDAGRIGVTGGSYGGFLSAWLITRSELFAAAVPLHPITDWVHQHGASNIPAWDALFLAEGQDVERSPVTHAAAVRTPTLLIAGGLDRATPPGQALAMHRALAAHGVPTECVTYPRSAHGTSDVRTTIDRTARIHDWFHRWMPADPTTPRSTHADHLG